MHTTGHDEGSKVILSGNHFLTTSLRPFDVTKLERSLCTGLRMVLRSSNAILAGGFIKSVLTDSLVRDVDVFFTCAEDANKFIEGVRKYFPLSKASNSAFGVTISNVANQDKIFEINVCTKFLFQGPEDLISGFDFTICYAAIWFSDDVDMVTNSVCHVDYYNHIEHRKLVYTPSPRNFPHCIKSLSRAFKFCSQGYVIDAESIVALRTAVVRQELLSSSTGDGE